MKKIPKPTLILIFLLSLFISGTFFVYFQLSAQPDKKNSINYPRPQTTPDSLTARPLQNKTWEREIRAAPTEKDGSLSIPQPDSQARITKKSFGIYIDPKNSLIQPERFQGFHSGTDFEIFENEFNLNITVNAICSGKIIDKKFIGGYGGVIIQSCEIESTAVTVLYGHLDLNKSLVQNNDTVEKSRPVAMLAADKSYYSAGERKHLHLGIHRGTTIDYRGYVQTKKQLESWINFEKISKTAPPPLTYKSNHHKRKYPI